MGHDRQRRCLDVGTASGPDRRSDRPQAVGTAGRVRRHVEHQVLARAAGPADLRRDVVPQGVRVRAVLRRADPAGRALHGREADRAVALLVPERRHHTVDRAQHGSDRHAVGARPGGQDEDSGHRVGRCRPGRGGGRVGGGCVHDRGGLDLDRGLEALRGGRLVHDLVTDGHGQGGADRDVGQGLGGHPDGLALGRLDPAQRRVVVVPLGVLLRVLLRGGVRPGLDELTDHGVTAGRVLRRGDGGRGRRRLGGGRGRGHGWLGGRRQGGGLRAARRFGDGRTARDLRVRRDRGRSRLGSGCRDEGREHRQGCGEHRAAQRAATSSVGHE
ncbi:unannotated protein [freshwater metagenome]|uniref:Unannotated protein n=1 Tax=freshwater metagenome TaxID=449393 RepID=A0A6J7I8K0_9ZZZZ